MRINTNMAALNAWRSMSSNQTNLQKSLGRLSSGYRINTAADDAAGLAVSEKMRAQIRGINMATRNTQDAVSLIQTAEGGAGKVQDMLQRMRELAVQASSDTLQDTDRAKLQEEFTSLQAEIDRTAGSVTFNGRQLINGASGDLATIASGAVGIKTVSASGLDSTLTSRTLRVTGAGPLITLASKDQWTSAINTDVAGGPQALVAADALNAVTNFGTNLDGKKMYISQGSKSFTIDFNATDAPGNVAVKTLNLAGFINYFNSKAQAAGVDATMAVSGGTNVTITSGTAGSSGRVNVTTDAITNGTFGFANNTVGADAQITGAGLKDMSTGASLIQNTDFTTSGNTITGKAGTIWQGISFTLDATVAAASISGDISISRNGLAFQVGANGGETINATLGNLTTTNLKVGTLQIGDKSGANGAVTTLDDALSTVSSERAKMGAMQNRLENTISNLQTQSENLTAAESRIRDVDMAQEMANFTKYQVLSQASTSMLAQANQLSQGILTLLR